MSKAEKVMDKIAPPDIRPDLRGILNLLDQCAKLTLTAREDAGDYEEKAGNLGYELKVMAQHLYSAKHAVEYVLSLADTKDTPHV